MQNHEHYTELSAAAACAFAVSGQLSEQEGGEWIEHCSLCSECRQLLREFMQVSYRLVSTSDSANGTGRSLVATARESREHLRAVALQDVGAPRIPTFRRLALYQLAGMVAALLLVVFTVGVSTGKRQALAQFASQSQPQHFNDTARTEARMRALESENAIVKAQLQGAQKSEEAISRERQQYKDSVAMAEAKTAALTFRIDSLEKANADLTSKDVSLNAEMVQLRKNLDEANAESEARLSALKTSQAELLERKTEVVRLSDQLKEAHRFNSTLKRAQALVEGRRVHVWDVHDTDESGKRLDAYARIVYAEGEGLDLYAFDLTKQEHIDNQISFYVWGEKAGTRQPIKSLGVLHLDDAKTNRWKLTFDDGNVLARINRVFVTAEPSKNGVTKPGGREIVSARLDAQTDHP
jgi:hypothetical protein